MSRIAVPDLGGYLREQREAAQMTLRQAAAAAGISNPYLSQIERGLRRPSAEILQQLAKGLQISAEQLGMKAGMLCGMLFPLVAIFVFCYIWKGQKNKESAVV